MGNARCACACGWITRVPLPHPRMFRIVCAWKPGNYFRASRRGSGNNSLDGGQWKLFFRKTKYESPKATELPTGDRHSNSCGWKKKKRADRLELYKNAAEMHILLRRTLLSIFNLAAFLRFLTNYSISCWSTSVWQEQKQTFLPCLCFF